MAFRKMVMRFWGVYRVQAAGIVLLSCTNNASRDTLSSMSEVKSKTLKAISQLYVYTYGHARVTHVSSFSVLMLAFPPSLVL
jgi:hypothetical protein